MPKLYPAYQESHDYTYNNPDSRYYAPTAEDAEYVVSELKKRLEGDLYYAVHVYMPNTLSMDRYEGRLPLRTDTIIDDVLYPIY